jgi:hypothetical protein
MFVKVLAAEDVLAGHAKAHHALRNGNQSVPQWRVSNLRVRGSLSPLTNWAKRMGHGPRVDVTVLHTTERRRVVVNSVRASFLFLASGGVHPRREK